MRQENYAVTGMGKMRVAFKIANGGFHLFTFSPILRRLDANILHFCIFQMRHLQVYAFPTMKQMYSLEIPVCSFLAKCPSTQVFSIAFIFLSLSISNLFTLLLFTSVYFSNSLKHNDIHPKVWRQPRCYFPWFEYQKWESNNKKILAAIFLLTVYCFSHRFLSFFPLIIAKDTIRLESTVVWQTRYGKKNTINWRDTTYFDSESDYCTGCRNISHHQQQ